MNKYRNKFFALIFGLYLFVPIFVLAQTPPAAAPATPPAAAPAAEAEPTAADNINVELKVPLPFVKTTDGKVQNLKDYIQGVYRLLIGVGALFAVVMIIIAGYQWMFSGGSSDKTGDAKKRIWNASIGLVLALLSYIILNTISSRLVELNLPKVEAIRSEIAGQGITCNSRDVLTQANLSANPKEFLAEVGTSLTEFNKSVAQAQCGRNYLLADGGGQCAGDLCFQGGYGEAGYAGTGDEGTIDTNKICIKGQCQDGYIYGNISWGGFILGANDYVDAIRLIAICNSSSGDPSNNVAARKEYSLTDEGKITRYVIRTGDFHQQKRSGSEGSDLVDTNRDGIRTYLENRCSTMGDLRGFAMKIEINDISSFWPTADDEFVLGKDCAAPLRSTDENGNFIYAGGKINWQSDVTDSQLFTVDDIMSGAECNLNINKDKFPPQ